MSRFACRIDDNQRTIVEALVACGCQVLSLAPMGNGCPDLLVERARKLFLLEVKNPKQAARARRLTPAQQQFKRTWPVHVVLSPIEALRAVGFVDARARAEEAGRIARAAIDAQLKALEGM